VRVPLFTAFDTTVHPQLLFTEKVNEEENESFKYAVPPPKFPVMPGSASRRIVEAGAWADDGVSADARKKKPYGFP
jgi:hypothetical protein